MSWQFGVVKTENLHSLRFEIIESRATSARKVGSSWSGNSAGKRGELRVKRCHSSPWDSKLIHTNSLTIRSIFLSLSPFILLVLAWRLWIILITDLADHETTDFLHVLSESLILEHKLLNSQSYFWLWYRRFLFSWNELQTLFADCFWTTKILPTKEKVQGSGKL